MESDFVLYMTLYCQDDGHDICPLLTAAYAVASAGCLLAHRPCVTVTSLASYSSSNTAVSLTVCCASDNIPVLEI